MAISTNPKPTIYRNLYENTSPDSDVSRGPRTERVELFFNDRTYHLFIIDLYFLFVNKDHHFY